MQLTISTWATLHNSYQRVPPSRIYPLFFSSQSQSHPPSRASKFSFHTFQTSPLRPPVSVDTQGWTPPGVVAHCFPLSIAGPSQPLLRPMVAAWATRCAIDTAHNPHDNVNKPPDPQAAEGEELKRGQGPVVSVELVHAELPKDEC